MIAVRRVLYALCLTALAGYTLAVWGGFAFYAVGLAEGLSSSRTGLFHGIAMAGAIIMTSLLGTGGLLSTFVLVITALRWTLARFLAPLPPLLGTLGFGAWLLSGDPGDEPWLRIVVAVSASCLALCTASAAAGFPPRALYASSEDERAESAP